MKIVVPRHGEMLWSTRISLLYFTFGLLVGFFYGLFVFRLKSGPKASEISCLIIQRSTSLKSLNATKATWLQKCRKVTIVRYTRGRKGPVDHCESSDAVIELFGSSSWSAFCQALTLSTPSSTEWLLIVPDSQLVFFENLQKFLEEKDFRGLHYFGHPLSHYMSSYNTLAAGVVLSQGALSALRARYPDKTACVESGVKYWNNEDVYLGWNLHKLGISPADTRDEKGRGRFHGYNVNSLLYPGKVFHNTDYFKKALYPIKEGFDCCSTGLITMGVSDSDQLLYQHFLTYNIQLPTVPAEVTNRRPTTGVSWIRSLREIGYKGQTDNITSEDYYRLWMEKITPEEIAENMFGAVET